MVSSCCCFLGLLRVLRVVCRSMDTGTGNESSQHCRAMRSAVGCGFPYRGSPTMGHPRVASWPRIWWFRPVRSSIPSSQQNVAASVLRLKDSSTMGSAILKMRNWHSCHLWLLLALSIAVFVEAASRMVGSAPALTNVLGALELASTKCYTIVLD